MRFGLLVVFTGSQMTAEVFRMVSDGCGMTTVKLPTPMSCTVPSTPSNPVTRTVHAPSEGEAGTAYWNWKIHVAAVSELHVAGAPCAVMSWFDTCVTFDGSMMLTRALEMSKLPNGSLICARTNTLAPG